MRRMGGGIGLGLKGRGVLTAPAAPTWKFLVNNDTEFATANTNAVAGDVIALADNGTFTNLTLTNATGVIVRGASMGTPIVRKFTINGAKNATVMGFKVRPDPASGAPTASPKLVDILGDVSGLTIDNLDIRGGNPWNGFADFDPTVTDAARMGSSASGYTDGVNPYAQDLWYGIGSSGSGATLISGQNITIQNCNITDLGGGIKFGLGSASTTSLKLLGNRIGRTYADVISIIINATSAQLTGLEICGNELFDPFAQRPDNTDPHSDFIQISVASTHTFPMKNWLIAGNVGWCSPNGRCNGQRIFIGGLNAGYPVIGGIFADNVWISRISDKGIYMNGGDVEGGAWCYLYRNILLANPVYNTPNGNMNDKNPFTNIGPVTVKTATINVLNSTNYGNPPNYIAKNIVENIVSNAGTVLVDNVQTGQALPESPDKYGTWLDTVTTAAWQAVNTADLALTAATPKAAHADKRPMVAGENASNFRARWASAVNRPWNQLPSWVKFTDKTDVAASTVTTSEWCFVHAGGPGNSRSINVSGCEYSVADDKDGLNATAWTSAGGTIPHGKFLRLRVTSSATLSGAVVASLTIGGDSFSWTVQTTAGASSFPTVLFDTATPDSYSTGTAQTMAAANSALGTVALMGFRMPTPGAPAATLRLFGETVANSTLQIEINTTGRIRLGVRNAEATTVTFLSTSNTTLCDGNYHDILWSFDLSQATIGAGASVYVDGVENNWSSSSWPATPDVAGYTRSVTMRVGGLASSKDFEFGALYINPGARVDITDPLKRAKFAPNQIGTNGTGPTGSAPWALLVGNASQWNAAGGVNFGTGPKFVKVGSAAVSDVGTGTAWA